MSLDYIPTAENLAQLAFTLLDPVYQDRYGNHLRLQQVRLYETPNCWADAARASAVILMTVAGSNGTRALILTGGGARAAYQIGAFLLAINRLRGKSKRNPFPIICGTQWRHQRSGASLPGRYSRQATGSLNDVLATHAHQVLKR